MIDGRRQLRFIRSDEETGTVVESRELLDVQTRLKHMDALGTEIQVIYPTMFLMEATEKTEVSVALRRSYNRWLADRCGKSGGRLRWVCLPPLLDIDESIKELRFAKEHGACGVLKKGDREADRWIADPYFLPLYEEAEKLDLPICIHTGSGIPDFSSAKDFSLAQFWRTKAAAVNGIETLVVNNIPSQFPKLRFGCIEAGASWASFIDYDLRRRAQSRAGRVSVLGGPQTVIKNNLFQENRIYITCQVDEDLPYILKFVGEDNLIVGSDYTHRDPSMEIEFRSLLQKRADRGEIPQSAVPKILYDNPKAFYGL
jgi:predicted TIM-barrel fold metal-dependent hydrolase